MISHFAMKLTQKQAQEYKKAGRKRKGEIISQYCQLTKVGRNLASKRLRKVALNPFPNTLKLKRNKLKSKGGRKPIYMYPHKMIVKQAWQLSGEICAERLHPVLPAYLNQLPAVFDDYGYYHLGCCAQTLGKTQLENICDQTGGNFNYDLRHSAGIEVASIEELLDRIVFNNSCG